MACGQGVKTILAMSSILLKMVSRVLNDDSKVVEDIKTSAKAEREEICKK